MSATRSALLVLLTGCFLLAATAQAAPSVSSVSGNITKGASVTISGSAFGAKSPAAPLIWADFEAGSITPSSLGQRTSWSDNENLVLTTDNQPATSSYCVVGTWDSATGKNSFSFLINKTYWARIYHYQKRHFAQDVGANQKTWRIWPEGYSGQNGFGQVYHYGEGMCYCSQESAMNPAPGGVYQGTPPSKQVWHVEEFIWQYEGGTGLNPDGSPGPGGTGIWDYRRNGVQQQHRENVCQAPNNQTHLHTDNFTDSANLLPDGSKVYMDNIYIDDTYAHVMLGNASTWSSCTQREIQIPSAWSGTSITITGNPGALSGTAYLYVIDSDNAINANGYAVTIGGGTTYTLTVNSGSGDGTYSQGAVVNISADTAPSGKTFDKWTGDTSGIANVNAASTTLTMPGANQTVTATYKDAVYYTLTVNSGSGDGSYTEGTVVNISADTAPSGKTFDKWIGNTNGIANLNAASTTLTMPGANQTVTATYRDVAYYTLTVNSGLGDGSYTQGTVVNISADAAPSGKVFDKWIGNTSGTANVNSASTTITMPAANATITATYKDAGGGGTTLLVNFGSSPANNTYGLSGWNTPFNNSAINYYTALGPAGIVGGSTGSEAYMGVSGTSHTFSAGDQIVVTWYQGGSSQVSFTPKVSFNDPDQYNGGTSGTWYDMSQLTLSEGQTGTTTYTVDSGSAGSRTLVNVARMVNNAYNLVCDKIELVTAATYTLTVNSGTGDGSYTQGAVVSISADAAPSGKTFDKWTGNTSGIANVNASNTTITMPPSNTTVTATYKDVLYTLTVNSGTGSGGYAAGTVLNISADAAPSGKTFDKWTGDTSAIADPNAASTTLTMPAANQTVTATYVNVYVLTVNSGSGDGVHRQGAVVDITADTAPSGMRFNQWTGDVACVANVSAASTTVTMPSASVEVTAAYSPLAIPGDLNGDGFVGQGDLNIVLSQWGRGAPPHEPITDSRADANLDDFVGQGDLNMVLANWGRGTPP